jgi:pSer/pThr/pTyr-binding forkhead associated (FHA) protein
VSLEGDRVSVGKGETNDVVLGHDATASRLHAVLERYAGGWSIRDLGSHNGTFVNGTGVIGEQALHNGDEIRIGSTKLAFKTSPATTDAPTKAAEPPPELTRRERDVLVALCRPKLSGDAFTEPASVKEIATALCVTEDAVKQHLSNLYAKFGIFAGPGTRRVRLAAEAMRRGAVSLADLR